MKVAICDPIDKKAIEELKALNVEIYDFSDLPKEELPEKLEDKEIIIVRSATKVKGELLDALKNAKLIIRGGVGLDNIDLEGAKAKGIKVVNTPEASSISVAELAIGFMFALSRHIVRGTVGLREGKWEKKQLKGTELFGKTLGLIGMGRIGREVAKRAKCLGMDVIATRHVREIPEELARTVSYDELYREADFISIHIPLTEKTRHMISKEAFEKMKDGVMIINCSRGGVVDEKALLEALKSGKVKGAALDVFEVEPPVGNELLKLDNVIGTPHIGASTKEAQARIGVAIVEKIKAFLEGKI
ncbi:MAG TPA: 3-phosphoglycerate dehydrogenase [candidate division WOR-3 bacterium]|uniref:3-phosphoglycerate dehydrogenase n=1 Tax=candidate division WOR-3 bacterium TaxID=2052148 RepID=A0A7V5HNK6_UNCW3|nr:3-phosphoglycerate dehydrogenase [candidate division WOR-3 bacterium]